ncbi:MAG: hypothetical protein J6N51_08520 [Selenomonas sp.]|nr:hypothetical protein [Selenomonas sp.]
MAMTVVNNPSAMMTLGELNKNINNQSKSQKKLSSGMKINGAGDDASAYAISERMRSHLRALNQDVDNVKNGRAMLSVAAGGIDNIVQELRSLKELAIKSANDSNTDKDRETIQKEFEQKMANIDDIATETNYNGKRLLNGTFVRPRSIPNEPTGEEVADLAKVGTISASDSGTYTISSNGLYQLQAGFTGNINIASGVSEVELVGAGSTLSNVYVTSSSSGVKLILKDYDVLNSGLGYNFPNTQPSSIRFAGSDNQIILKGNNSIAIDRFASNPNNAIINMANGLTISNGDADGQGTLKFDYIYRNGAAIGTDRDQISSGDINILGGNIQINSKYLGTGAAIGTGWNSYMGDINIIGGKITIATSQPGGEEGAGIGSGGSGRVGNINISKAVLDITTGEGAGIGSGGGIRYNMDSRVGNISIDNSIITVRTEKGAGVGSGAAGIWDDSHVASIAGNITIDSSDISFTTSSDAEEVGRGVDGTVGSVTRIPGVPDLPKVVERYTEDKPLVFQIGTRANQALHCYINDMHTDAMGLSGTQVVTRAAAQWALSDDKSNPPRIGAIDQAINYALNEATTVGAYISRLETTEDNLVISSENAQSSESTIRDADMAKEMAEFTKNNVLAQASQSMLAQANQNSSSVLSLLQ